jgi:large subunit ribosomal protein L9
MEVLLWQDVDKLGKRGQVVKVADGFARNFLFPRKLATAPTAQHLKRFEMERKKYEKREARLMSDMTSIADKIAQLSCTLELRANEEGVLYGAVSADIIAEALKKEGIAAEPAWITMEQPIKELGVYTVPMKLCQQVECNLRLWVVEGGDR